MELGEGGEGGRNLVKEGRGERRQSFIMVLFLAAGLKRYCAKPDSSTVHLQLEAQTGTSLAPEPLLVCEDQSLLFVSHVPRQKNHHTNPVLTVTDV